MDSEARLKQELTDLLGEEPRADIRIDRNEVILSDAEQCARLMKKLKVTEIGIYPGGSGHYFFGVGVREAGSKVVADFWNIRLQIQPDHHERREEGTYLRFGAVEVQQLDDYTERKERFGRYNKNAVPLLELRE